MIDDDERLFPTKLLRKWKESAELSATAALGKAIDRLGGYLRDIAPEEIDLLCAAAKEGNIQLLEVDEINPWVVVEGTWFADPTDPAFAAAYFDALQSLEERGLVRPSEGTLHSLTSAGFQLARALRQAREEAASLVEDDEENEVDDDDDSVLFDDRVKLGPDEFVPFPFELSDRYGVRYTVDAEDRVDVFILDDSDYKTWRNEDRLDGYYEFHKRERRIDEEFWPEQGGNFFLVVSNETAGKNVANVTVVLVENE